MILSLYMVADRDRLMASIFRLVPPAYKEEAKLLEVSVARSFGGFLRGQAILGLVYAAVAIIASAAFGLDYLAVTVAAAGLLMAIPFFGPFLAWAPPVLVALVTKPDATLGVLVVMAVGWLVVMNVLQPRLMAQALRIHPIIVLGSVLVGGKIAGISGAIFGIPIAAVLSAFFSTPSGGPWIRRRSRRGRPSASATARAAPCASRASRIRSPTATWSRRRGPRRVGLARRSRLNSRVAGLRPVLI